MYLLATSVGPPCLDQAEPSFLGLQKCLHTSQHRFSNMLALIYVCSSLVLSTFVSLSMGDNRRSVVRENMFLSFEDNGSYCLKSFCHFFTSQLWNASMNIEWKQWWLRHDSQQKTVSNHTGFFREALIYDPVFQPRRTPDSLAYSSLCCDCSVCSVKIRKDAWALSNWVLTCKFAITQRVWLN